MIEKIKQLINRAVAHDGLKVYGANASWLFVEKIFRMAIGFTVGIYVARQLGPTQYGLLNYAISFAAIFSILANLGLDSIVVRELVKYPDKRDKLLGSTFVMKLAGFFVMLAGIGIGLYFSSNDQSTNLIVLVIAAGYLFQIFQTIEFYFQAQVLSKYVAISQIIAWSLVSCGRAFFAWQGYPLIYFAGLEAINMCLMAFGYLFFYITKISHPFHWRFDFSIAKDLLKNSWPLFLSSGTVMIYMRIDQVMIKSMLGDTQVGYYAVAVRLSELWYFVPTIICTSFFPAIIRSREVSLQHYEGRLQKLYSLLATFSIALSVSVFIISPFLIRLLYGASYSPASGVLNIYIWTILTISLCSVLGQWVVIENLQLLSMYVSIIGVPFNIILNYIFIKLYGLNGAALSTLIIPFISQGLFFICCKKIRHQFFMMLKAILFVWVFKAIMNFKRS